MLHQGWGGSIVNMASVGSMLATPGASLYVASKHAVVGLTKSAAIEYGPQGIRVNAVSPGSIRTEMLREVFGGDEVLNRMVAIHPKDGDYIVYQKDVGGGEWYQFFRYDFATGDSTLLTDGKSRNTSLRWSQGGDQIVYVSTRRNKQDTDLWAMNPTDPKTDHMLTQLIGGGWEPQGWSPDDKQVLLMEEISVNETYLWLVNSSTGEKTELTPRKTGEQVTYAAANFSRDGKGVYVSTDKDSQFLRLAYIDLATKKMTIVTPDLS